MQNDDIRARFLSDRVLTATPAQRVVMLYDRMILDLNRAATLIEAGQSAEAGPQLGHALQIVVELQTSLDRAVGGLAVNLDALYAYVITQLIDVRGGASELLPGVVSIVSRLRESWARVAEGTAPSADQVQADGALAAAAADGVWVS